ncbi:guanylate kinase [Hyphobacterium sp. SN044]|uniref:guanylate kinase n=1 Tax=Hyphobacterium sp. SN044 TaxID=2912575 RepID=UPI001EFF68FB|nr:guanylate kinase [Hyphobacterium sp. SN044]MCF8878709.1 guanylate kinase [Hyphobacterium sp. SN044]
MSSDPYHSPRYPGGRRGMMFVLSSPSGAGKTTLSKRLMDKNPDILISVSWTTRAPRPGEENGRDYVFVSQDEFEKNIAANGFYEYAKVFDHYYGTPRAPVEEALAEGRDVIFDIDWQGARLLAEAAPNDAVRVFILPPSLRLLEDRLRKRGQDPEAVISRRMDRAEAEISHWNEYDYVIVNEDFARALEEIDLILHAERLRRTRRPWLEGFVSELFKERK